MVDKDDIAGREHLFSEVVVFEMIPVAQQDACLRMLLRKQILEFIIVITGVKPFHLDAWIFGVEIHPDAVAELNACREVIGGVDNPFHLRLHGHHHVYCLPVMVGNLHEGEVIAFSDILEVHHRRVVYIRTDVFVFLRHYLV